MLYLHEMHIDDKLQTKEYAPSVFSNERILTISGDDLNISLDIIAELTQKFINEDLLKIRQTLIQTLEIAACSMMIVADAEKQLDEAINKVFGAGEPTNYKYGIIYYYETIQESTEDKINIIRNNFFININCWGY